MKAFILEILVLTLAVHLSLAQQQGIPGEAQAHAQPHQKKACGPCPYIYAPECGIDGQTYPNRCVRECSGVPLWYPGECKTSPVPPSPPPVPPYPQPPFPQPPYPKPPGSCICAAVVDPECGVDGITYENGCRRQCAGVPLLHKGECQSYPVPAPPPPFPQPQPRPCYCTLQYDPECGVDGKTYSNSCQRQCAGVPLQHKGECYATHMLPAQQ